MTTETEPRELTVEEAAEIAGCRPANVYRAIRLELVKARPVPIATKSGVKSAKMEWRVDEESLREWRKTVRIGRPPNRGEWPGQPGFAVAHA